MAHTLVAVALLLVAAFVLGYALGARRAHRARRLPVSARLVALRAVIEERRRQVGNTEVR